MGLEWPFLYEMVLLQICHCQRSQIIEEAADVANMSFTNPADPTGSPIILMICLSRQVTSFS